jgi:hypothetical protein
MAAKSQDKILFGAALVLLLASAGWMALQGSKLSALRASSEAAVNPAAYVPAGIDAPVTTSTTWPTAPAQTTGPEWIYDLFTPPEIYYNEATKKFTVTPPEIVKPEDRVDTKPIPFGVDLVQVKQDAFRLQLVGYIGVEGDYRGTFENAISGETIIGRAGKVIAGLDLTIRSFDVKRNTILSKDSMPVIETEATAVVVDNKTGEVTTLSNKNKHIKGTPFAVIKVSGSTETTDYKADAKFTVGDATYTVLRVTTEPPSVEIRKEAPGLKQAETKTLTPEGSNDPVGAPVPAASEPEAPPATVPPPFTFGN